MNVTEGSFDLNNILSAIKESAEQGRLIEGGWFGLLAMSRHNSYDAVTHARMRMAFFAGAQHAWAAMSTIIDNEESDISLRHMLLIEKELKAFMEQFMKDNNITPDDFRAPTDAKN